VPAWGWVKKASASDTDAAFVAGAGLATLDAFVRAGSVSAGVWRQPLALTAAAATAPLIGQREEEAALRDDWYLPASGEDPGPAGSVAGHLAKSLLRQIAGTCSLDFSAAPFASAAS